MNENALQATPGNSSLIGKSNKVPVIEGSSHGQVGNQKRRISKWDGEGQCNQLKCRFRFILSTLFCFVSVLLEEN